MAVVKEIRAGHVRARLYLYQVEWQGHTYFLDPFLELVGKESSIDVDGVTLFYAQELQCYPLYENIQRARGKLGKDLVNAFVAVYIEQFSGKVNILLRMGIHPEESNNNNNSVSSSLTTADVVPLFLLSLYTESSRDLYLSWTYAFLRQRKKYQWRDRNHVHYLARVLCWKGKLEWELSVPCSLELLYNGEERGLALLAMARNRPAGENVFAQLPRDLMKMIFDWIQWSLPLEL